MGTHREDDNIGQASKEAEKPESQQHGATMQACENGDRQVLTDAELAADGDVALDPSIQAHLGDLLRLMYGSLIDAPVPEKILERLRELDRAENNQ